MQRSSLHLAAGLLCLAASGSHAQSVVVTEHVGPLAHPEAAVLGDQGVAPKYYGSDLGMSVAHKGVLRFYFGDTAMTENYLCDADPGFEDQEYTFFMQADDAQGYLSLSDFPEGSRQTAPSLTFATDLAFPGRIKPVRMFDGFEPKYTHGGTVPAAAFSTGEELYAIWGLVTIGDPGSGTLRPPCPAPYQTLSPCDGFGDCCYDPTSSQLYDFRSVVGRRAIARMDDSDPNTFRVAWTWNTHKFGLASARTVNHFNPSAPFGIGNDYSPSDGVGPGSEKVLLFGRTTGFGVQAAGVEAKLYLAYVDIPAGGEMTAWEPMYLTGTFFGTPQWSSDSSAAVPVDLSGGFFDPTHEVFDVVNWHTASYVEPLGKWVMLYGGDMPNFLVGFSERLPFPGIFARYADNPWGPWTEPELVLDQGWLYSCINPYADGSLLWSTQFGNCTPTDLIRHDIDTNQVCCQTTPLCDPDRADLDVGRLYGPNVVDHWTEDHSFSFFGIDYDIADTYWNISTWNPYGVQLMKTRFMNVSL
ncbi:MAG: hypothetical protein OXT09_10690 [Myxococcales bacterium]|nr:hypothetical protein [Myxococcales bacterium]